MSDTLTGGNGPDAEPVTLEDWEIAKLKAETRALERQETRGSRVIEWMKAVAGLAGVIAAVAALYGLWDSVGRYQDERVQKRESDQIAQLNRNIPLLADDNQAKQLVGVAALESFLGSENPKFRRQVLSVLINILAIEDDKVVRDAIVNTLKTLDVSTLKPEIASSVLQQVAAWSRVLVEQGQLNRNWEKQQPYIVREGNDRNGGHSESRARSISELIVFLLRQGARTTDLSGIYCPECDLTEVTLPGVSFARATLFDADFSGATMIGASFQDADLAGARFVGADLKNTRFTVSKGRTPKDRRDSYFVWFAEFESDSDGPSFDCADLRGADFSGHPIFGFVHQDVYNTDLAPYFQFPSFIGADLDRTDFSAARMFGQKMALADTPFASAGGISRRDSENTQSLFEYDFSEYEDEPRELEPYRGSLSRLKQLFSGSAWSRAKLPKSVKQYLSAEPPAVTMNFPVIDFVCTPRSTRAGFAPTLPLRFRDKLEVAEIEGSLNAVHVEEIAASIYWLQDKHPAESLDILIHDRFLRLLDMQDELAYREGSLLSYLLTHLDYAELDLLIKDLRTYGAEDAARALQPFSEIPKRTMPEDVQDPTKATEKLLDKEHPNWRTVDQKLYAIPDFAKVITAFVTANMAAMLAPFQKILAPKPQP